MSLIPITEVPDLKGKRVLVRVDWNVPLADGTVRDDFRIKKSLKTLEFLKNAGAKVIVISHLEPEEASLKPIAEYTNDFFPLAWNNLESDATILENLRNDPREKANDEAFAKELASKADIYVNEAFSASHRKHASIVGVPKFLPSFAGIQFMEEYERLSNAFNPPHPFVFILGGAKFDTKLPLLEKFIELADTVFVGGALAHNFFREEGMEIGHSVVSEGNFDLLKKLATGKIMLPKDVTVTGTDRSIELASGVSAEEKIMDAGPETVLALREKVIAAKFVLWNGPVGLYEEGYREGTQDVARLLAEADAETIVGGADTLAAIKELKLEDQFSFISTAGGAMLDFLANETLPGIEVLNQE